MGVGGVWAELGIHNWFKPIVEFGLGMADYMPKDESYRYKSGMAPYFKIGLNYNFLYNSTPDYSVYLGLRYGISSFSYRIEDVTAINGYWDESTTLSVPSQHATAGYFEFLLDYVSRYGVIYIPWMGIACTQIIASGYTSLWRSMVHTRIWNRWVTFFLEHSL